MYEVYKRRFELNSLIKMTLSRLISLIEKYLPFIIINIMMIYIIDTYTRFVLFFFFKNTPGHNH